MLEQSIDLSYILKRIWKWISFTWEQILIGFYVYSKSI